MLDFLWSFRDSRYFLLFLFLLRCRFFLLLLLFFGLCFLILFLLLLRDSCLHLKLNLSLLLSNLFGLKSFLLFDHGLDTVVHVLDEIDFRATKSTLVRDVIDVVVSFSVLAMGTSDLYMETVCDGLEVCFLLP
jgi:hypothetical protein